VSERPIAVGDLVVQVRGHSCALGDIFRVTGIKTSYPGYWTCKECGAKWYSNPLVYAEDGSRGGAALSELKRIPPLDELESTKTDERIGETA